MLGLCRALFMESFPHHSQLSAHFADERGKSWGRLSDLPKIRSKSNNTSAYGVSPGCVPGLGPSPRGKKRRPTALGRCAWSPGHCAHPALSLFCPVLWGLRQLCGDPGA